MYRSIEKEAKTEKLPVRRDRINQDNNSARGVFISSKAFTTSSLCVIVCVCMETTRLTWHTRSQEETTSEKEKETKREPNESIACDWFVCTRVKSSANNHNHNHTQRLLRRSTTSLLAVDLLVRKPAAPACFFVNLCEAEQCQREKRVVFLYINRTFTFTFHLRVLNSLYCWILLRNRMLLKKESRKNRIINTAVIHFAKNSR